MNYLLRVITITFFYSLTLNGMENPYLNDISLEDKTQHVTTYICCCKAIFNSSRERIQHIETAHTFHRNITNEELQKYYACQLCAKEFFDIKHILEHECEWDIDLSPQNNSLVYYNLIEDKASETTNTLSSQTLDLPDYLIIKETESGKKYECTICNKIIKKNFNIKQHINLHQKYSREVDFLISLKKPFCDNNQKKPFYCPACNLNK